MTLARKSSLILIIKFLIFLLLIQSCNPIIDEPHKPLIVIMFDDGFENVYQNAFSIMKKYSFPGVNAVCSENLGKPGIQSWEQVVEMDSLFGWETASHMPYHESLLGLTEEHLREALEIEVINYKIHHLTVETFAAPNGMIREEQCEIIFEYFPNLRVIKDFKNFKPINNRLLGYFTVFRDYTVDDVIQRVLMGINDGESLIILGFHDVCENSNNSDITCTPELFESIIEFLFENELKVVALSDALKILE